MTKNVIIKINSKFILFNFYSSDYLVQVKDQISKTLTYMKEADKQNETNVSDTDAKLCTELKILAQADMETLVTSISSDEKDQIITMLEILLNLTKECSHDIVSTYSNLESLRDKIRAIPIQDTIAEECDRSQVQIPDGPNEIVDDDEGSEEEFEEEEDDCQSEIKAQLASDTTKVNKSEVCIMCIVISFFYS